jgi:hypothetical protein
LKQYKKKKKNPTKINNINIKFIHYKYITHLIITVKQLNTIQIKMKGHDDHRRNNGTYRNIVNTNPNNLSNHNLINPKDYHKPLLTR